MLGVFSNYRNVINYGVKHFSTKVAKNLVYGTIKYAAIFPKGEMLPEEFAQRMNSVISRSLKEILSSDDSLYDVQVMESNTVVEHLGELPNNDV